MALMRFSIALLLALGAPLALTACPGDDDDSALDDDDSAGGDDDDTGDDDDDDDTGGDDDDTGDDDDDDDTGDDDDDVDYVDAVVPDFADCSGNQVKFTLGDGTELAAVSDIVTSASFANNNGQFTIRIGTDGVLDDGLWAALSGHREGMPAGTPINFATPAQTPGNVVLQALIGTDHVGSAPTATAGTYGMPQVGLDSRVMGSVTFASLPEPGVETSGTFEGIIQKTQGVGTENVVLLGASGCFAATLEATDI